MARVYFEMFAQVIRGMVVVAIVAVGLIAAWGLQIAGIEALARLLGASAIEAWGWGHLAAIPTVIELVAILFLISYWEDRHAAATTR